MTKHLREIAPSSIENVSRRALLKGMVGGGGLVLALSVLPPGVARAAEAKWGGDGMPHGTVNDPLVFVSIAPDGTVTIVCHRSEMGQGIRTGMPLIVADELDADWSRVKIAQAPGDEVKYGNQDTDGSRSTRHFFKPMRQVGAAMRMMLEEAAAKRWGVAASDVEAKNHEVVQKSTGKKLGYGELAADAAKLAVPATDSLQLKDPSQFRYIGKEGTNIVDAFDITTGRAKYGQDVRLPGMKYAVIARPAVMGGKVKSYDATAAKKIPGVLQIVEIPAPSYPLAFQPSGGLAVIADNTWAAHPGPQRAEDRMGRRPARELRFGRLPRGDGGDLPQARHGLAQPTATSTPLSPRRTRRSRPNITSRTTPMRRWSRLPRPARSSDGKAEVWTSVQSPQAAHDLVSKYLGLPGDKVTVNVTLLGGGFGRRSKPDFAVEAALCSKAMGGAPVKVVWTREDDIHNDFYHTVSVERLEAGLDKDGKVVAWRHNSVAPTIFALFMPDPKHEVPLEQGMGLVDMPFSAPNIKIENGEAEAHTKIGWLRSVSNIPHGFAIQSFVAELAAAAGKDQKTFLLDLIGPPRIVPVAQIVKNFWDYGENPEVYPVDTGRLRHVIELVTEKAGWGRALPKGHGLGLAAHRSFVSYVAAVIETAVDEKGNVTVPRVDIAIDCGPIVNPDRVRSQLEGAVVQGLGIGLMNEISFKNGRVQQSNFDDFMMMRITDAPRETHVYVVPHGYDVPMGGVGEPGVPPIAPALMNAIFAASGKRVRALPMGQMSRGA